MENMVESNPQADTATFAEFLATSAQTSPETAQQASAPAPETAQAAPTQAAPAQTTSAQTTPTVDAKPKPQADAATRTYTQKDFDEAVRTKTSIIERNVEKKLQSKVESDPAVVLGRYLLSQTGETDPVKAAEKFLSTTTQARAAELAKDPVAMAKAFLEAQVPKFESKQQPTQQADDDPVRDVAMSIAQEVEECFTNNELPPDFDPGNVIAYEESHPGFLKYAGERGLRSALLRFSTQPSIASAVAQVQSLPQQTRPSTQIPSKPNFSERAMTSEQFAEYSKWRARQIALGRPVDD